MTVIKRLVFSAVLSGVVVGALITVLQSFTVIPMIATAETFENSENSLSLLQEGHLQGNNGAVETHDEDSGTSHSHVENHQHDNNDHHGNNDRHGNNDHHGNNEWSPDDGIERMLYTALTNILASIGFSLLLATCFMFRENTDWRKGLLWGLGGFIAFQLAPSLGLPPELPGTEAAAVEARQLWWIATAISTATGLMLLVVTKGRIIKMTGLLFIVVPHIIGAPQPVEHAALAPQALITQFIIVTTVLGVIFWMMLGAVTAYTHSRLG